MSKRRMRRRANVPELALKMRGTALGTVDALSWIMALTMAAATSVSLGERTLDRRALLGLMAVAAIVQLARGIWTNALFGGFRIGSVDESVGVSKGWALTSGVVILVDHVVLGLVVPTLPLILSLPLALLIMLGVRLAWSLWRDRRLRPAFEGEHQRVLVFGAGEGADQIIRAMLRDPDSRFLPVAMLDDDETKARRQLSGVRVRGTRREMAAVAIATNASLLLIAIPSAKAELIADLDELGRNAGLEVRVLPAVTELVGMLTTGDIRELTEADLLGRAEVHVDMDSIRSYVSGRRVLVTGAGGSIGSELCRQLARLDCEALIMLDRDESGLHGTQLAIENKALLDSRCPVVADIRDRDRIFEVFAEHQPHVVFHAAALKHLTLLELYPEEGRKTNVDGSRNVLDAAEIAGVECYVNVSTDKAADPSSVLGRTKLEAERLTAAKAATAAGTFVSVRFGNVLGSRGSVLPIFRHQIAKGGPITVTHPDVTRYFMTIPEAVRLVLQAGAIGRPGEVMILDMGQPVKIVDLARQLIRHAGVDIDIEFTGLRPGEKLNEILVSKSEIAVTRQHARVLHAMPHDAVSTPAPISAVVTENDVPSGRSFN